MKTLFGKEHPLEMTTLLGSNNPGLPYKVPYPQLCLCNNNPLGRGCRQQLNCLQDSSFRGLHCMGHVVVHHPGNNTPGGRLILKGRRCLLGNTIPRVQSTGTCPKYHRCNENSQGRLCRLTPTSPRDRNFLQRRCTVPGSMDRRRSSYRSHRQILQVGWIRQGNSFQAVQYIATAASCLRDNNARLGRERHWRTNSLPDSSSQPGRCRALCRSLPR
mmetsp:Transcript_4983/g.15656  ORF Transcript_4983/g.15656 Transcript_4983/m.15656 type:complete len:216 (-) Transcript_4983:3805-4452(-)